MIAEGERNGAFTETGATGADRLARPHHPPHPRRGTTAREARRPARPPRHRPRRDGRRPGPRRPGRGDLSRGRRAPASDSPAELCEKELVGLADHYDAKELKVHGRRVLAIVDPDAADAHEAKLLEREERAATKATSFSMWDTGDGQVKGKFTLARTRGRDAPEGTHRARRPEARPRQRRDLRPRTPHRRTTRPGVRRVRVPLPRRQAPPRRRHQRHRRGHAWSSTRSSAAYEPPASTPAAESPPAAARRLACEAGIIPAVLDSKSRVLDLGRKVRFHTESQRLALAITQKHCQSPGCTVPAWLCHVHHTKPWSRGGHTNLDDAELQCPRHHTLIHRDPPTPPMRT